MSDPNPRHVDVPLDPESDEARRLLSADERQHEEALGRAVESGTFVVDDLLEG